MKIRGKAELSLRAKFKDFNTIEITVVDHLVNETFQIFWSFRSDKIEAQAQKADDKVNLQFDESGNLEDFPTEDDSQEEDE